MEADTEEELSGVVDEVRTALAQYRTEAKLCREEAWEASAVASIAGSASAAQRSSMRSPAGPECSLPAIEACTAIA